MTRAQVERVAEAWALRATEEPADRANALAGRIGGMVEPDPAAPNLIVAASASRFLISAGGAWPIAVALGHLALHLPHADLEAEGPRLAVPVRVSSAGPLARARAEATWFAAAFLMPGPAFRGEWSRLHGSLESVARRFGVPMVSAAARALRLGLSHEHC